MQYILDLGEKISAFMTGLELFIGIAVIMSSIDSKKHYTSILLPIHEKRKTINNFQAVQV